MKKAALIFVIFPCVCSGVQPSFNYPKVSPTATTVYELQSNKERTHFYVDGNELPSGRRVKILIDDNPHTVVAQPEKCISKEEYIQPPYDSNAPLSFTFLMGECNDSLNTIATEPSRVSTTSVRPPPKKQAAASTERLVLMPLRVGEEDRRLQGAMETALVQGLQRNYVVFSGEQVTQKAQEIFRKESHSAKKECDETRCMQGIAEAFQAELIATANVTKQDGGYFLAISIQNIFDNKVVYSNSVPCENCTSFQVVNKLKELSSQ